MLGEPAFISRYVENISLSTYLHDIMYIMKQKIAVEPEPVFLLMVRNASTDISWRECNPCEITVLMRITGKTIHDEP